MASFNTTLYTAQIGAAGASLNAQSAYPRARDARGKLRIVQVKYALAGTEAANDLIYLTKLQPGDRVIAGLSRIICEDPGTSLTVRIGDASDALRYAGTIDISAGGDFPFSGTAGTDLYVPSDVTVAVPPSSATDQTAVIMKVIAANTLTAGAKILVLLAVVAE